jgi:hypothetical protein
VSAFTDRGDEHLGDLAGERDRRRLPALADDPQGRLAAEDRAEVLDPRADRLRHPQAEERHQRDERELHGLRPRRLEQALHLALVERQLSGLVDVHLRTPQEHRRVRLHVVVDDGEPVVAEHRGEVVRDAPRDVATLALQIPDEELEVHAFGIERIEVVVEAPGEEKPKRVGVAPEGVPGVPGEIGRGGERPERGGLPGRHGEGARHQGPPRLRLAARYPRAVRVAAVRASHRTDGPGEERTDGSSPFRADGATVPSIRSHNGGASSGRTGQTGGPAEEHRRRNGDPCRTPARPRSGASRPSSTTR